MRFIKYFGITVLVILLIVGALFIYFTLSFPDVDAPKDIKVEITPARLARGEYLANHVTVCIDCHSMRDWSKYAAPPKPGTHGGGGDYFDEFIGGVPGKIYIPNITPHKLKDYSDGELLRAITQGVTREGKAMFPIMPYPSYNQLTQEDAYSLIAYLRNLETIQRDTKESSLNFPMNLIVKTIPLKSYNPSEPVDTSNVVAYGKYLARIAGCADCHTPMEKGEYIKGMEYAGGMKFQFPGGVVSSANISPDNNNGIGRWTEQDFVNRFKAYDSDSSRSISVAPEDFNTPMPWTMYAGMTEKDMKAIYAFLRTVPANNNKVLRFDTSKKLAVVPVSE